MLLELPPASHSQKDKQRMSPYDTRLAFPEGTNCLSLPESPQGQPHFEPLENQTANSPKLWVCHLCGCGAAGCSQECGAREADGGVCAQEKVLKRPGVPLNCGDTKNLKTDLVSDKDGGLALWALMTMTVDEIPLEARPVTGHSQEVLLLCSQSSSGNQSSCP